MNYPDVIEKAFNDFNGKNLEILDLFYSKHVQFADPVTEITGLDQLKKYYAHAYKNVKSIRFEFNEFVTEGNRVVGFWVLRMEVRGLNSGKPFSVIGNSRFDFDKSGKVSYHRDYLDLGAMVYEKLPLQGKVIKAIKGFLKP